MFPPLSYIHVTSQSMFERYEICIMLEWCAPLILSCGHLCLSTNPSMYHWGFGKRLYSKSFKALLVLGNQLLVGEELLLFGGAKGGHGGGHGAGPSDDRMGIFSLRGFYFFRPPCSHYGKPPIHFKQLPLCNRQKWGKYIHKIALTPLVSEEENGNRKAQNKKKLHRCYFDFTNNKIFSIHWIHKKTQNSFAKCILGKFRNIQS